MLVYGVHSKRLYSTLKSPLLTTILSEIRIVSQSYKWSNLLCTYLLPCIQTLSFLITVLQSGTYFVSEFTNQIKVNREDVRAVSTGCINFDYTL